MITFWSDEYFLLKKKYHCKPLAHNSFVGSAMHVLVNLCGGKKGGCLTFMKIRNPMCTLA